VAGGLHSVVVRLLAAFRSVWCYSATSSAVWDNVEGQRLHQRQPVRTWPAADHDGVFSTAEHSRCGTMSEDGAGDIFGLLSSRVATSARGKQCDDIEPQWWSSGGLIRAGGQGTSFFYLDSNPWNKSGAWSRAADWRSPCTRERHVERLFGGPRARESYAQQRKWLAPRALGAFELGVLHAVGWSDEVQQYYDSASCTAVTLSARWCLPLCFVICGG
jgi:hypothetical protein